MQRRTLDHRPSWPLQVNEPIAGNYYPITSGAAMIGNAGGAIGPASGGGVEGARKGGGRKLVLEVATDRAQGAASLQDGQLEVMVHRWVISVGAGGKLLFCEVLF